MRLIGSIALAIVAAALLPAQVSAQAYETMPVTSASPGDGAAFLHSYGPIPFEFSSPYTGLDPYIEVATQNIPGQDGTLADDYQVDFVAAPESDAYPGTYRGSSNYAPSALWWSSTPGTYFWQAQSVCYSPGLPHCSEDVRYYKTPVYRIEIRASAPPSGGGQGGTGRSMSAAQARRYIKRMIRAETNGRVRKLRRRCTRLSFRSFRCRLRWRIRRYTYAGTARFVHTQSAGKVWSNYYFKGKRHRLNCRSRCNRRLNW